jgi:hypothetical protein
MSSSNELDGTRLVTADGQQLLTDLAHAGRVRTAVFSPDGSTFATASAAGTAIEWVPPAARSSRRWWGNLLRSARMAPTC